MHTNHSLILFPKIRGYVLPLCKKDTTRICTFFAVSVDLKGCFIGGDTEIEQYRGLPLLICCSRAQEK